MKITQESWNVLVDPRIVVIPTAQELLDFYIEVLRKNGIAKDPDVFLPLAKHLPPQGQPFILIPQTNFTSGELMARIVVNGVRGRSYLDETYIKDVIQTPNRHYLAIGIEDGRRMLGVSSENAIKAFSKSKRSGLTVKEGIFLLIYFPKILKHHSIDLLGSRYDSGRMGHLWLSGDGPWLSWRYLGSADSKWNAASCGSRV